MGSSSRAKIAVLLSFVLMVAVNAGANIFSLNGMNTGQVSDLFANLFTPAGYTFAIWSLIYLLLLLYVLYTLGLFHGRESSIGEDDARALETAFVISSLANMAWIPAWHYLITPLSMLLTIVMLCSIGYAVNLLRSMKLDAKDRLLVKLPFSVYFGWLTVATIANACVVLVSFGFTGVPFADIWTVAILIIGLGIASFTALRNADVAYALVVIWAYVGILAQHVSPAGYGGRYSDIIATLVASIIVLAVIVIVICMRKRRMANDATS